MRVLIVSQYFTPEGGAAFYSASLARELVRKGHNVRVLTGYPNYPTGVLYPGYTMKWRQQESQDGVSILRVPLYLDHSNNALRRIANYVSYAVSSTMARKWAKGSDVVYVYATQMTPALGPWLWRMLGGPPYVLHVQDLWPDSITGSSLVGGCMARRFIEGLLTPWLRSVYSRAAAVVGIAPTMVETLVARGVAPERAKLVYNWAEGSSGASARPQETAARDATEFLYAGNVGDMQDLETLVRAAARVAASSVNVTVVGDGVATNRVRDVAREIGASNVVFEGSVPMRDVSAFYRRADFALVTLRDLATFRGTIPSKFQAALAHGVPVVSNVQGDLRELVEALGVGFTSDAEDVHALAQTIMRAAEANLHERAAMIRRAEEAHRSMFSIDAGASTLEKILEEAANSCSGDITR